MIQDIIALIEKYASEKAGVQFVCPFSAKQEVKEEAPAKEFNLTELVRKHAAEHGLDPAIVYGIVISESAGNPFAARFEPLFKWILDPANQRPKGCSIDTEKTFQMISLSLMQVMGAVYREQGYKGWLPAIFADPDMQMHHGCKHLAIKIKKYGPTDGIASYNSGSPRRDAEGCLKNQSYVDHVLENAKNWEG